jgi:hypothetical protein
MSEKGNNITRLGNFYFFPKYIDQSNRWKLINQRQLAIFPANQRRA